MKSFCKDLREHATEITVKKENATTNKKGKTILQTTFFDNAKKNLVVIMTKDIVNFDTIVITQANMHSIFNLRCKRQKEITAVLHNGSNYGYHFIMKELAEERAVVMLGRKCKKIHNVFSTNTKRTCKL